MDIVVKYTNRGTSMCVNVYTEMFRNQCIGVCNKHAHRCLLTHVDMCTDMDTDMCTNTSIGVYTGRHVHRNVYRRWC